MKVHDVLGETDWGWWREWVRAKRTGLAKAACSGGV